MHDVDLPLESSTLLSGSYPDGSGSVVRSGEDDGAVSVEQHPMLGVPAHRLRQHPALDVLPLGLQHGHRVLVPGPRHVLLDDRPLIEVRRHVVRRRPDELDPALVRLGVGARPLEGRQERVVDVDDAPVQPLAQGGGEDLHVAGQHHQLDVEGVHQPQQLGLGGLLGLLGDRDVVEGHPVELGDVPQRLVVAHHADDVDRQPLTAGSEEQVGQAVPLLGDHDEGAHGAPHLIEAPLHLVLAGQLGQVLLQLHARHGGEHLDPHEEQPGGGVPELLGLGDVPAAARQRAGDRVDDARTVGAGQGQDQVGGGVGLRRGVSHGLSLVGARAS